MTRRAREFSPDWIDDPTVVAVNRLAPHSDHRWYATDAEAAARDSSYETVLDGTWRYRHADAPGLVPDGLEAADCDLSDWDEIPVPAHVQLHGYDRPQYVNVQYPWDGREDVDPPRAPARYNPVSTYATDVDLDAPADGQGLRLVIDGAESACALWVNGRFIGYSTDSFTPAEFDITGAAEPGRNRIVIRVWKWCAGSWLEDQDFFRFSGIFRSVRLLRTPRAHVEDLHVVADVHDDPARAVLTVEARLDGPGAPRCRVDCDLAGVGPLAPDGPGRWRLEIDRPRLWSDEDPHLYDLAVRVSDEDGRLLEHIPVDVGLRRFGIEDGLLRINGRRAVLKGINRHEFGLDGRVVDRARTDADLRALKALGVNAIRTSHYPNSTDLYELCDRYGLYVIDEANLETHGTWDPIVRGRRPIDDAVPGDRPEWSGAVVDRAESMILRDRNHPCVVMWSLGNESFGGTVLRDLADHVRALDDRPVHYQGIEEDGRHPQTSDVASLMYPSARAVADHLREHRDKPLILCEYAHAMGHSLGAVDDYLELMRSDALFQGAFVWDFADQALPLGDDAGRLGYGGDFGDAPHDADFCGNGVFFADHTPTPKARELAHLYRPIRMTIGAGGIEVVNDYAFTGASELTCALELARWGRPIDSRTVDLTAGPGQSERIEPPFEIPDDGAEYTITAVVRRRGATAWAPAGQVVAWDQGVVSASPSAVRRARAVGPLELIEGRHNIGVRGDGFSVLFSRLAGGLQSYRLEGGSGPGRELLRRVPAVNFWHAPTANERGWGAPAEDGQWLLASRYAFPERGFDALGAVRLDDRVRVEWGLVLPSAPAGSASIRADVFADGRVDTTVVVDPGPGLPPPPEFGVLFALDPALGRLRWYGDGPEETSADRRSGALLGLHEARVVDQLTPYLRPQESGGHTGVRWASVTDDAGEGIAFEAGGAPMEFSALAWSLFEVENAAHPQDLPVQTATWVRAMAMRRGAAGDDSWGARPHPRYELPEGRLEFSFSFRGIGPTRETGGFS
ncbi:DUF4981 domain-containing protein [Actinomyces sp. B33]|uniref:glycoside hydrolase family 2 TIM barrel-domain containing protein n=1 Tax=Actinomyces sp. B33 TaxID=2942131 RepID=UPI00233FD6B8|nr:glycoside hydrolase family 2 TIM barrel-domain containing protein [Actinomyces sp. B33]MDC4233677.1 DUF4981 domain-containing protein [Actinomyces sp. B33]